MSSDISKKKLIFFSIYMGGSSFIAKECVEVEVFCVYFLC